MTITRVCLSMQMREDPEVLQKHLAALNGTAKPGKVDLTELFDLRTQLSFPFV